jgi:hypothetical protein
VSRFKVCDKEFDRTKLLATLYRQRVEIKDGINAKLTPGFRRAKCIPDEFPRRILCARKAAQRSVTRLGDVHGSETASSGLIGGKATDHSLLAPRRNSPGEPLFCMGGDFIHTEVAALAFGAE